MNIPGEKTIIGCTYSPRDGISCDYKDVKGKGGIASESPEMDNLSLVLENDSRLYSLVSKHSPNFDNIKKRIGELGKEQAERISKEYMFDVENNVRFFIPPRRGE